jgi:hypothetical protein
MDALIILLASLFGGFVYHWASEALASTNIFRSAWLRASLIWSGWMDAAIYDFESAAKPNIELAEILISWLATGVGAGLFRL